MIRRLAVEAAALVLLALACAWVANAMAGPTRHLSWFPREVRALPTTPPVPTLEPRMVPVPDPPKVQPKRPVPTPKADPAAELLARFPPLLDAPQAEISPADARWLHDRGALFLDARRSALHAQGHIAGAKVISVWEDGVADKIERLSMFTKDLKAPLVIYCSGGDCHDSHLLAEKLWLAGFRNLRIYTGGFPDWEARGWPVAKGDAP